MEFFNLIMLISEIASYVLYLSMIILSIIMMFGFKNRFKKKVINKYKEESFNRISF